MKQPKKAWKPFVDDAEWAVNQCMMYVGGEGSREWLRELNAAARFLAANYRVNRELLVTLELITPENVMQVLMRATDRNKLIELSNALKN